MRAIACLAGVYVALVAVEVVLVVSLLLMVFGE